MFMVLTSWLGQFSARLKTEMFLYAATRQRNLHNFYDKTAWNWVKHKCWNWTELNWLKVIARVRPVRAMNAEQRQTAADLWTKPKDLSHWPAWNYIHRRQYIFTIPQRVEVWVDQST